MYFVFDLGLVGFTQAHESRVIPVPQPFFPPSAILWWCQGFKHQPEQLSHRRLWHCNVYKLGFNNTKGLFVSLKQNCFTAAATLLRCFICVALQLVRFDDFCFDTFWKYAVILSFSISFYTHQILY